MQYIKIISTWHNPYDQNILLHNYLFMNLYQILLFSYLFVYIVYKASRLRNHSRLTVLFLLKLCSVYRLVVNLMSALSPLHMQPVSIASFNVI